MAWSDFFTGSNAQSADDAQANLNRLNALEAQRLAARQAAGTITPDQAQLYVNDANLPNSNVAAEQNAAAAEGLEEGAREGLNNVLDAPGKLVGAVGSGLSQAVGGILKNIPLWVYALALVALFIWMGGLTLLRGRLSRS